MYWLLQKLRAHMSNYSAVHQELLEVGGGYTWSCDTEPAMAKYFQRKDVQTALHLEAPLQCRFGYQSSGPASVTLYPFLATKLRILIYNGDADSCVPYKGNEEWTEDLAAKGVITQEKAWHPWFTDETPSMPAGYATNYRASSNSSLDFSFVTIRLAGHMVPLFQPSPSFTFF